MNWDDLRFFIAVASAGSLSGAAHQLRVNTTTVLRRVASLEDDLAARLFERERTGYRLTPEGERLLNVLEPVDRRLSSLWRDFKASGSGMEGSVRVAAGETVATALIARALPSFQERHPGLDLDLVTDAALASPAAPRLSNILRDVDIAIRAARPTQGDMLMRKIGEMAYGLYGTPDYLSAHPPLAAMNGIGGHTLIGFGRDESPLGPVWWLSRAEKQGKTVFRSSSVAARAAAARAGMGLAALPCIQGDEDAGLVRVFGSDIVGSLELWLLARNDLALQTHVRTVMDFLVAVLKENRSRLEGGGVKINALPGARAQNAP